MKICAHSFNLFKESIDFDEPIPPFETRFPGLLEGIINSTRQTFDKKLLNPTIEDAASAYFNNIVRGHPFKNGNKRLAVLFTHVFLILNGCDINLSYQAMYNLAVIIADYSILGLKAKETKIGCKKIFQKYVYQVK